MANTSISKSTSQNSFIVQEPIFAQEPVAINDCLVYLTLVTDTLTKRDYIHARAVNSHGKTVFAWADFGDRPLDVSASKAAYQFMTKHPNETQLDIFKKWAKRWEKAPRADRLFVGRSEL